MAGFPATYYRNYTSDDTVYDDNHGWMGDPSVSIETLGWDAPPGYTFKEWNAYRDGTGIGFQPGDSLLDIQFAIWEKIPTPKKYIANDQSLIAVADAIREKTETTGKLPFPTGFVTAINNIHKGRPKKMIYGHGNEKETIRNQEWFEEDFHSPTRNSFCVYLFYYEPGDSWMVMTFDPSNLDSSDLVAYSCELDSTIYRAKFSCTFDGSYLSSITMYEFSVCSGGFDDPGEDFTESIGDWFIMYFEF